MLGQQTSELLVANAPLDILRRYEDELDSLLSFGIARREPYFY